VYERAHHRILLSIRGLQGGVVGQLFCINSLGLERSNVCGVESSMLMIEEIFRHRGIERRSIERTRIDGSALMFFAGQDGVFSCGLRDATNHGAGIRLNGLNIVPLRFDLSFDNFRTIRMCRLVWRDNDFIGVAFGSPVP
jgi:hypothetical protein